MFWKDSARQKCATPADRIPSAFPQWLHTPRAWRHRVPRERFAVDWCACCSPAHSSWPNVKNLHHGAIYELLLALQNYSIRQVLLRELLRPIVVALIAQNKCCSVALLSSCCQDSPVGCSGITLQRRWMPRSKTRNIARTRMTRIVVISAIPS